jgi:hypothetical protein
MRRSKASILDVIAAGLLLLFFGGFAAVNLLAGQFVGGLLLGLLALLCAWVFFSDIQRGIRPPTRWEWFKLWMIARPVLAVAIGISLILLLFQIGTFPPTDLAAGMLVVVALLWAGLIFYLIWQAPQRHESDAAYRRRIGYEEAGP